MANKPNNPALWSRAKSLAKQKFDVYPSAYANGWASKWYKGKGGSWRTAEYGMQVNDEMADGGEKMPPEIARARFAAAGNLDQLDNYGYAYGGYSPEMMHGGYHYMQQGGSQDQVMQIIQMYAQMNKIDPKQLMQKLQQMPAEQQKQAIQQMMQTVQQGGGAQQQLDMEQAAMAYGGYTTGMFVEGGMIRRADGSYSKRGLWDNIRANKGSGKKASSEMLEQQRNIREREAAYGGVYGNGGTNNAGFEALPEYVQAKILSNMGYGGYYNPMSEMAEGGETENGDTNAGMAMGQIAAMHDKLSRLQKFITGPDTEVDPWVASKITLADDYLNSVADYMQYGEQQESENEMPDDDNEQGEMMANGGYTVTRSNDRKGKTHKVTGPGGVVKYFGDSNLGQHPKDPKRKAAFYARHKHNLDNNPFFRAFARKTWQNGGQPDYSSILDQNAADAEKYPSAYHKDYVTGYPVANSAGSIPRPGGFDCPPGYTKYSNGDGSFSCRMTNEFHGTKSDLRGLTKVADDIQFYNQNMQKSLAAAPIRKNGGSTFSGNAFYQGGGQSVIVNDPNDPRLTAYNDSLYKYNSTNRFNNFLDRYQTGVDDVDKSLNKYNTLKRANKELSTNKAINKFSYFVPHGGGSPIINGEYNIFKKPTQQVMYLPASNMADGGIHLDPAKRGTFKAQATRMGMGVQEAASSILNAPEGRYSPAMRKKANFAKNFAKQMGGPVEGDVLDVTPEELHMLKQGGYNFEIID